MEGHGFNLGVVPSHDVCRLSLNFSDRGLEVMRQGGVLRLELRLQKIEVLKLIFN